MQTETQCHRCDKTSKSQTSRSRRPTRQGQREFAYSDRMCKERGTDKRPHAPAQLRDRVVHEPVLYPDTVVSQSTNRCSQDTRLPNSVPRPARAAVSLVPLRRHHTLRRPVHRCGPNIFPLYSCAAKRSHTLHKFVVLRTKPQPHGA